MFKLRIGAVLASVALLLTFAGTAVAGAGGQTTWDHNGYPIADGCSKGDVAPGEVLWIFTGESTTGVVLHLNGQTYDGTQKGGGSWHIVSAWFDAAPTGAYVTWTGDYAPEQGVLTISHGCAGTTTTTTTADSTSTTDTTTADSTTDTTTTADTTTDGTTTADTTTDGTTTDGTTTATTTTGSPTGSVEGVTGKPQITPPATDALRSASRTASGAWNAVLVLLTVLTFSILVLTPVAKRRRK